MPRVRLSHATQLSAMIGEFRRSSSHPLDIVDFSRKGRGMVEGFQFPKIMMTWMDAHSGTAGWAQAVIAGLAIVAVYYAATIPVRAEAKRLDEERKARAHGLKLLLLPEVLVLQGELEAAVAGGSVSDPAITVSSTLMDRADHMYLMGDTGWRLLEVIGMVNAAAAQTRRLHAICDTKGIAKIQRATVGRELWENNAANYERCLNHLEAVLADMNPRQKVVPQNE